MQDIDLEVQSDRVQMKIFDCVFVNRLPHKIDVAAVRAKFSDDRL